MHEVTYLKTESDGRLMRVMCMIDDRGRRTFVEQSLNNDVDWRSFTPSEDEQGVLMQIMQELSTDNGASALHFEERGLTVDWNR